MLCCLFNSKKQYAYQVGKFCGDWEVTRVIVKKCVKCETKTIENPRYGSREYETYLVGTLTDVEAISRMNNIPLLSKLEN